LGLKTNDLSTDAILTYIGLNYSTTIITAKQTQIGKEKASIVIANSLKQNTK